MNPNPPSLIRAAGRDDAVDLAHLLAQLGYPTDPPIVIARLAQLEATALDQILVYETQGRVLGCIGVHITPAYLHIPGPIARITTLIVATAYARQGIGTQLVRAVEELARQIGCTSIEVSSNKHRAPAHALYETLGYLASHELFRKTLDP